MTTQAKERRIEFEVTGCVWVVEWRITKWEKWEIYTIQLSRSKARKFLIRHKMFAPDNCFARVRKYVPEAKNG